jgi:FMN phosphatase YigB (HAD superfamily)
VEREGRRDLVLVDLDGTLLSAGRAFTAACFAFLSWRLLPVFGPRRFVSALRLCTDVLLAEPSPGASTNFERVLREGARHELRPGAFAEALERFYDEDFPGFRRFCRPIEGSRDALLALKARGCRLALATNPVWPERCVLRRLEWAGIDPALFEFRSHSENMHSTKPRLSYYRECLERLGAQAGQTWLVGDSKIKDGPAAQIGVRTWILEPGKGWGEFLEENAKG